MLIILGVDVMPFCPECGKEVSEGAVFCPNCGSQVRRGGDQGWKAGTGFDLLLADGRVQRNWSRRVVAYIIDSVIVALTTAIVGALLVLPLVISTLMEGRLWTWRGFFGFPFSMGVVQIFYFTLLEGGYGASVGKQIMGLEVVNARGGRPTIANALVRNISKVFWALLLLDVFIGLVSRFDPRQKFTDQISGTRVVYVGEGSRSRVSRPMPEEERSARPGAEVDFLGGISAGVVLIIIAAFFLLHRGVFPDVVAWLRGWGASGPTMIPESLLPPLIWFLTVVGVWSLVLAFIRMVSGLGRKSSVSDAFSGMFMLSAAYMLRMYASGLIQLSVLLPGLVVALGATVFLGSALSYVLYGRLLPKA